MIDKEKYKALGCDKIITYQPNFQERFVRSNVDFAIGGAAMGVGKSFAALLMAAEPSLDPNFRMVYIRKNIQDTKVGGGGCDEAMKIYGHCATLKLSENPRLTFNNGSFIDFTHMNDQTPDKVLERIRGWQYSVIYFDEGTGFEWSTVRLIFSRNRGAGKWTGKIRITCNPKKSHWLRIWLDWWIDPITGFVIPERDGVVRYFYITGDTVKDVVFGDSKKEVYYKCKSQIDGILSKMNSNGSKYTYEDLVKSTTLYSGLLSDNKALLENNPGYIGSIAAMGEKQALANLQGNFNVDIDDDSESPIPAHAARAIFETDPMTNGDRWITADLADKGTDNFLAIVWDGLHVMDIVIKGKTTPRQNAEILHDLAVRFDIADNHIIFDGNNAAYINDYIPDAVPFVSYKLPRGMYARQVCSLKDESYMRLVYIINNQLMSFNPKVADRIYYHQKMKEQIPISTEFVEECSVVRFKDQAAGKKRLFNKHEMNVALGKGRSMDLLDPMAMRMYPFCMYEYGTELEKTAGYAREEEEEHNVYGGRMNVNIYDDSTWA